MATNELPKNVEQGKAHPQGRGGAGNMSTQKPKGAADATELKTPVITSGTYTTGRGGSGNMASNDSAESARRAQDVDAPEHHQNEPQGTYHWGRGGEGNKMTIGSDKEARSRSRSKGRPAERRGSIQAAVDKGKEMFGMRKGSKDRDAVKGDAVAVDEA